MTKKSNTLILVGLNGLRRVSAMKFRPYLTRLIARLPLLSILIALKRYVKLNALLQ